MLKINNLNLALGKFQLKDINLDVPIGSYYVLLGESGAGKSMLLETIMGLQIPDSGSIYLNRNNISRNLISSRSVGLLFQDYALFPHLTVYDNIAYALRSIKKTKNETGKRVEVLASDFGIKHLLNRKPAKLSGGEQQRVALARTLALKPDLLLLDEPLSSLDVQLKHEIKPLLKQLHRMGQTIIHVTHDYEEALSLATHIAVIHQGSIIQTGTPDEVFQNPKTKFVASFTGEQNFFKANLYAEEGHDTFAAQIGAGLKVRMFTQSIERHGYILIPKKSIIISDQNLEINTLNHFEGTISEIYPGNLGYELIVDVGLPMHVAISSELLNKSGFKTGQKAWLSFKASSVKYYPSDL